MQAEPSLPSISHDPSSSRGGSALPTTQLRILRPPARLLVVLCLVSGLMVAAAPRGGAQEASSCPPAAGEHMGFDPVVEDDPNDVGTGELDARRLAAGAPDAYDLIVRGGGFGHGIGASQYGMRGAAELGCTHDEIIETYFPGVKVGPADTMVPIRVGLWPSTPSGGDVTVISVANVGAQPLPWRLVSADAGAPENPADDPPVQPAGATWVVRTEADATFTIRDGTAQDAAKIWPVAGTAGGPGWRLLADLGPTRVRLPANGRDYQRGILEFTATAASAMRVVVEVPTIEQYLYGLGEVPSSWHTEALAAQAVAGRAYAITAVTGPGRANCACDLYDTVYDQFYAGATKEDGTYGPAWVAGVDASAGQVLTYDFADDEEPPVVVRAFYSSSNGGASSAAWDIWGSDPDLYPYLGPVNSAAWEQVDVSGAQDGGPDGIVDNPYHRWSSGYTNDELAVLLGVDEVADVTVVERAPGGRPCRSVSSANPCEPRDLGSGEPVPANGVEVHATLGGDEVIQTFDSEGIRGRLGGFPRMLSGLVAFDEDPAPFSSPVVNVRRLAGSDRIATAVSLSQEAWDTSEVVVVARSDDPADALAGAGLAGLEHAPLLLTRSGELPPEVADELSRLKASRVWVLGGPAAVSDGVVNAVRDLGIEATRMAGADRFETAIEIARHIAPEKVGRVLLVRGRNVEDPSRSWPDALSVSGLAARQAAAGDAWPILATGASLPASTAAALDELAPERVTIVGGTAVISDEIEQAIQAEGRKVGRRGGADRYATSRLVAALDDPAGQHLVAATGSNFPDGLAAGPYAAQTNAVLLLVPRALDEDSSPWLDGQHPQLVQGFRWNDSLLTIVGGTSAIEDAVRSHLARLLRTVPPSTPA